MAKTVPLEVRVIYNSAAMREALETVSDALHTIAGSISPEFCASVADDAKTKIRAALAAPARNIDAIPEDEMVRAFKRDNCDQYENSSEDPRTCCEGRCVECIVKWMIKQHETD